MMKKLLFILCLSGLLFIDSCKKNEIPEPEGATLIASQSGMPGINLSQGEANNLEVIFGWNQKDEIAILSESAPKISLSIISEEDISEGGTLATFSGSTSLTKDKKYTAFYPGTISGSDIGSTIIDLTKQIQIGNDNLSHLAPYNYMTSVFTNTSDNQRIEFKNETIIMSFKLKAPYGITESPDLMRMSIVSEHSLYEKKGIASDTETSNKVDFIDLGLSNVEPQDGYYVLHLMMLPFTLNSNDEISIELPFGDDVYGYKMIFANKTNFIKGNRYFMTIEDYEEPEGTFYLEDYSIVVMLNGEEHTLYGQYSNPTETEKDYVITIDLPSVTFNAQGNMKNNNDIKSFTSIPFIDNIDKIVASYVSTKDVKVNGTTQTSEVTENDFRKNVVYSVEGRTYKVVINSPQTTGLPVIQINTVDGSEPKSKEIYTPCSFYLDYNGAKGVNNEDLENVSLNLTGDGVRLRGNTTINLYKNPYILKLDKKKDAAFFGLGGAKSWVLLANYFDPTHLMNYMAMYTGREILKLPYTNNIFFTEVYFNGSYRGIYTFTEQVQVNEFRVNIDEESDFFLELDNGYDEEYKFKSSTNEMPVNIKSPEFTTKDDPRFKEIQTIFNDFESTMFDESYPNNNYESKIDVKSVIDFYMVNEIVKNPELHYPRSTYIYYTGKDSERKFYFGPLWDFDLSYDNNQDVSITPFSEWHAHMTLAEVWKASINSSGKRPGSSLFNRFFEDPLFVEAYQTRWNECYPDFLKLTDHIREIAPYVRASAIYDRNLWDAYQNNFDVYIERMIKYLNIRIPALNTYVKNLDEGDK